MAKPPAPKVQVRKWGSGRWTDSPDAVVTEEPLQLMLGGEPLSVVMRTPGNDIELALGLFHSEGIIKTLDEVRGIRISAEAEETAEGLTVDASIVESNAIDIQLNGKPRRKPERSMMSSSACGVCGAVLIEDLKRDLATLPVGMTVNPTLLPGLAERLRSGQSVFDRTGGLHAASLFSGQGALICLREDVGRHNAVDKVVGHALMNGLHAVVLVVSGRAGFEIVQKAAMAGIPVVAAVSAPTSLSVDTAREAGLTLAAFVRDGHLNVYAGAHRLTSLASTPLA